ncbi:hypothetical protein LX36DRAFT_474376 [Colletotrichum falcatum]|nr:hypothetical protein LX36DRAFT_474376 [Colletotrichum falcatum]
MFAPVVFLATCIYIFICDHALGAIKRGIDVSHWTRSENPGGKEPVVSSSERREISSSQVSKRSRTFFKYWSSEDHCSIRERKESCFCTRPEASRLMYRLAEFGTLGTDTSLADPA